MRQTAEIRVSSYLKGHSGVEYCDQCLAERTGLGRRRAVWRATKLLGSQPGYQRSKKTCSHCGYTRMVIQAVKT